MMHILFRLSALLTLLSPAAAFAAATGLPPTPCPPSVPGCPGSGPVRAANIVAGNLGQIADFMVLVAAALAVVFIVYAGFRMVIALGDESQITEQKHAVLYVLVGLLFVILSQMIVSFVLTQDYGQTGNPNDFFQNAAKAAVSILLTVFNGAMVVAVIVGGAYMLHSQGKSDQFTKGKTILQWSIGGAIVANLAAALIQALLRLFNIS